MDTNNKVYLDYAATTPMDERVLAAMMPFFVDQFGNPSSIHQWGQDADAAIEQAREKIAGLLKCRSEEIVFTACGTESDNLALRGTAWMQRKKRGANRILISPVEHSAVSKTARQLSEEFGFIVEYLSVDPFGRVDAAEITGCLRKDTALVSVVYANNEIGTINPIAEIGAICRKQGVIFHTDAVQAAAHLPMNVIRDQVDLLSIGAHKFYGPKGVGALYVHRGTELLPIITGGKQEEGLRGGTQNVAYIVGMATALELAQKDMTERSARMTQMRDWLIQAVLNEIPQARLTGHPTMRLPNHASFVFEGVDGNALLMILDLAGFACSSGSACRVGSPQPSDILIAIGLSKNWALGSLRVTLGRNTTQHDLERFVEALPAAVQKAKKRI